MPLDSKELPVLTYDEWKSRAVELFGDDPMQWTFVCPSCGHVTKVQDWKDAGAPEGQVAYSCVGRAMSSEVDICSDKGPCNYAGGGLLRLNPQVVRFPDGSMHSCFAFYEGETKDGNAS